MIKKTELEESLGALMSTAEAFRVCMVEHALCHVPQNLFLHKLRALESQIARAQHLIAMTQQSRGKNGH